MRGRLDGALQTLLAQQAVISNDLSALRADTARAITHLEVIDQRNKTADEDHRDFETRIRILEGFKDKLTGKIAVMATIGGVIAGWMGYLLGHFIH